MTLELMLCDVATNTVLQCNSIAAAVSVGVGGQQAMGNDMHGGGGSISCVQNRLVITIGKKKKHTLGPRGAFP